jgi:hypothetical protein
VSGSGGGPPRTSLYRSRMKHMVINMKVRHLWKSANLWTASPLVHMMCIFCPKYGPHLLDIAIGTSVLLE